MASGTTDPGLLRCPKNLKECIDWVLRATERDNGTGNIEKLKNALNAELGSFNNNSNALTQLVQGLCLFMGYPSCVCSLKANVDKSLQDISEKLLKDSEAVQSCVSISKLDLNCSNCIPNDILCKCCVISCIKELPTQSQSKCDCIKNPSKECQCSNTKGKCCKDFLSGLEACLSLLNLQTDLAVCDCKCDGKNCCKNGTCINSSCTLCSPKKFPDNAMTGLGLLRPSPKRLAEKLEKFFGQGSKTCGCKCGSGSTSCCCLACPGNCLKSCSCNNSGCSCAQALKTSQCPRLTFCIAINDIKIPAQSTERTCCDGGKKCHCEVDQKCQSTSTSSSGQGLKCCIETSGSNYKHSIKCMLRRLVKFFSGLGSHSGNFFKSCCDLLCVAKTCYFLHNTLKNTTQGDGKKFHDALQTLKYSSPCGHDLWRVLDDFLQCCFRIFNPDKKFVENKVKALQKACSNCCQAGTSCDCSSVSVTSPSSGSCQACTSLLGDSKLMSVLLSQYSSSYDSSSAKWESLCPTTPKPPKCCCGQPSCSCSKSSSPCCQSSSSPCDPSKCCPDCPQRKAAKIFLGMLPCLYYGLKILYDRSKYDSGFAGWHDISVNSDGKPESALAKFLSAWGFQTIESSGSSTIHMNPLLQAMVLPVLLENLFTPESSVNFKNLYENCKIYFTSFPSSSLSSVSTSKSPPTTVRQMLLWLYGLRFHKHFSDLVENCKSLCSPFGNSFHPDAFCYYIHTCSFIVPVAVISTIETSDSAQNVFSSSSPEWESFYYPSDPSSLADMLFKYIRKIFAALNFLCLQCERVPGQGGWQNCWYGQKCSVEPLPSSSASGSSSSNSGCQCQGSDKYLCTKDHSGKCSAGSSGSCSSPCPHPLQAFLCHSKPNSDSDSQSQNYPFGLSGIVPMGFESSKLSSTARDGLSLYHVLKVFCDDGFYPLTRLTEFSFCIFRNPPETLGELFAFFKRFVSSSVFRNHFADYVSKEPGWYSGEDLKSALENLFKHNSHSGSHPFDLYSLSSCDGGSSCGKYLYSLTYNAYKDFIKDFLDTYLSWVCYSAEDFKKKLKEFQGEFSSCCSSGSCTKIVECPCALPLIYSRGFQFMSPGNLNGGKKCSDFIDQVGHVIQETSPLGLLIKAIEEFIWSIRLPFFLFVLAFWAFVISYFLYVQLYKLDLLHLKSHAHLSRSFKILPSTLFSDASSKLKDLSYFSL